MPERSVTVVVPTLAADAKLLECLDSLEKQSFQDFETVVVDNSSCGAIHRLGAAKYRFRLIENQRNAGFGEAVNQGWRLAPSNYLAVLNDDAVAHPRWLGSLTQALEANPEAGMAASCILLQGKQLLDSAGLGIARDGSSKQVSRMQPAGAEGQPREALIPSGCAALYRGKMLEEVGLFDPDFFLYCEDTDLALRGHWAGWRCLYVPEAVVEHHYSSSAGRASETKAYFVERNRLRLLVKNFPLSWLVLSPVYSIWRYLLHLVSVFRGGSKAAEFSASGGPFWVLPWIVVKAHVALLTALPLLLSQRAKAREGRRIGAGEFKLRLKRHRISLWEVAGQ